MVTTYRRSILLCFLLTLATGPLCAGDRPRTNVPATLEIEVIDPGVDPLGNPAVLLDRSDPYNVKVDIPPVILVHRFYYSGDRSFQGPAMPGGPSILVFNHPKNGKRCYVPVQMPPGAPEVTYKKSGIEYDFGETGVELSFTLIGAKPVVKYRSGYSIHQKIRKALHTEEIKQHAGQAMHQAGRIAGGAAIGVGGAIKNGVLLPAANVVRTLPFGQVIVDPDLGKKLSDNYLQHKRDHGIRKTQRQNERYDGSFRTNR